jgi:hypothetical protein
MMRMAARSSAGGVSLEEAAGAGSQRGVYVLVEVECGQDEDPGRLSGRVLAGDLAGRRHPVGPWHPDVHQEHVGLGCPGKLDGPGSVGGLPDYLQAGLRGDQCPEARAHQRVIVGDRDPDAHRAAASAGSRAVTW